MRIHVLIVAAALPLTPLAISPALPSQATRDACSIWANGAANGPSADICAQVVRRWVLLGAGPLQPGRIHLAANSSRQIVNGVWTLTWSLPVGNNPDSVRRADGIVRYFAENVLPHEAGHEVFDAFLRTIGIPVATNAYVSVLPDWLDESPAIWMESKAMREQRMRRIRDSVPSLATLVTMKNPASFTSHDVLFADFIPATTTTLPPCPKCTFWPESIRTKFRVTAIGVHANGRADTLTRFFDHDPVNATFADREFYPLAYSLLRFIHVRGGSAAIRELIERYRKDSTPRFSVLAGLPGLPATTAEFERAWQEFVKSPPRENQ